jgi:hypothetical protein
MTLVRRAAIAVNSYAGLIHAPLFLGFPLPSEGREHCGVRCGHFHIHEPPHDVLFDGYYPVWIKRFGQRARVRMRL